MAKKKKKPSGVWRMHMMEDTPEKQPEKQPEIAPESTPTEQPAEKQPETTAEKQPTEQPAEKPKRPTEPGKGVNECKNCGVLKYTAAKVCWNCGAKKPEKESTAAPTPRKPAKSTPAAPATPTEPNWDAVDLLWDAEGQAGSVDKLRDQIRSVRKILDEFGSWEAVDRGITQVEKSIQRATERAKKT